MRDIRGIHAHERAFHRTEYDRAKNRGATTFTEQAALAQPSPDLTKVDGRTKTRPPNLALDMLLARIERDMATPTGREMAARAEARTPKERAEMMLTYPAFNGLVYSGSYLDRGIR